MDKSYLKYLKYKRKYTEFKKNSMTGGDIPADATSIKIDDTLLSELIVNPRAQAYGVTKKMLTVDEKYYYRMKNNPDDYGIIILLEKKPRSLPSTITDYKIRYVSSSIPDKVNTETVFTDDDSQFLFFNYFISLLNKT
jgi:hypothetical protein